MATRTRLGRMTIVLAGLISLLVPTLILAHPLGNFSINHYTNLRLESQYIVVLYLLDLAEIPTFQEIQDNGLVPEAGHASVPGYLAKRVDTLQQGLIVEINDKRLSLQSTSSNILFPPGAGGLATLKLGLEYRAAFDATSDAHYRLTYRDTNFAGRTGWHEIIVSAGTDVTIVQSSVPNTDRSQALTDYPTDLLSSPPQVLEAQVVFHLPPASSPGAVALQVPGTLPPVAPLATNAQGTPRNSFTELITTRQLSFGMIVLALLVAAGLGAFHALEPGHGKTVVAAYLVGSRGTARHALYLGLIVTLTHTAGVYLLGFITLYASQYIVPERLYPWLGITSGLMIAGLGCYLFFQRYAMMIRERLHTHNHYHIHNQEHDHDHAHLLAHAHAHDEGHMHVHEHSQHPHHHAGSHHEHAHTHAEHHHGHRHGHHGHHGHHHDHTLPEGAVSFRQLLALGITGGIVPCPAALVVLLSAVSLQRIGFGLLLIVAFSAGLALVLIAIGILMVYAQRFMARFQGEGPFLTRWLPLTSAALITLFGIAMVIQTMQSTGMLQFRL